MKVKSQVMSNIVRMLENEGPFKDVIYVILENVSKYLKMPDVTVMQYDEERTCLYPVLSYGGRHHLIQAAEVQAAAAQTAPQGTVERQVKRRQIVRFMVRNCAITGQTRHRSRCVWHLRMQISKRA